MTNVNSRFKMAFRLPVETGVIALLVVISLWLARTFPSFHTGANISDIFSNCSETGIVAAAMTLVIATGGIDISVGSVVGLCGVILGTLTVNHSWSLYTAIPITILAGAFCGWINGTLISRFKLPPIIATLAMFSAARAGAYVLSGGDSISGLPDALTNLGYGSWMGVPISVWIAGTILVLMGILLKKTRFGRQILSLGGNRVAAQLSGVNIMRTEASVYVISGMMAGLASIIVTARGATAVPDAGQFFELRAITAVVVGGTPVIGGRATMIGTALGLLTMRVVQNGVTLYKKDGMWENLVMAVVLLLAVEVDRWRRTREMKAS